MNLPSIEDLVSREYQWKALAAGTGILAGMAAREALKAGWNAVTDDDPPAHPESSSTPWGQALLWTLSMSIVVGVTQLIARRGLAGAWEGLTGEEPPM